MTPSSEPTLFAGGRVYTSRRYVRALLIEDGRVVALGTEEEVRRSAPTGTEHVDLNDRLVVPGLADPHVHVGELARARDGPELSTARSVESLREAIRRWATGRPGVPVVGRGFDLSGFAPSEWPNAASLDRAVDDRPVLVYDRSGHVAVVNSAALDRLGLGRSPAPDEPPGVGRAPSGEPTGVLVEEAMRRLAAAAVGNAPASDAALRGTVDELLGYGLTSVGAMSVGPEELSALERIADGRPAPKIRCWVRLHRLSEFPRDRLLRPSARVRAVGAKTFADGAFGPHTAALYAPYDDLPTERGIEAVDESELRERLGTATSLGLSPAVHAIGDRAVERAAVVLRDLGPSPGPPSRIEHASLAPPRTFRVLRESGACLVVQPGFLRTDTWLELRLGAARARWAYPFRTLIDQGLPLAGSSDAPFCPPDPWWGMDAAVRRRDPDGRSANAEPSEALAPEEAFALFAPRAHEVLGVAQGGTLEAGAPADLLLLRVRTLAEAVGTRTPVAETWVEGVRLARDPSPGAPPA